MKKIILLACIALLLLNALPAIAQEPDCTVLVNEANHLLVRIEQLADAGDIATGYVLLNSAYDMLATCSTSCPGLTGLAPMREEDEFNADVLKVFVRSMRTIFRTCPYQALYEGSAIAFQYPGTLVLSETRSPGANLYIIASTPVDLGGFAIFEGDPEELANNQALVNLLQEGLVIAVLEVSGDPDDIGLEDDLLGELMELAEDFDLAEPLSTTGQSRNFTVDGASAAEMSGKVPGGGALTGRTMGIYGALINNSDAVVLVIAGAPDVVFDERYDEITALVESIEFK